MVKRKARKTERSSVNQYLFVHRMFTKGKVNMNDPVAVKKYMDEKRGRDKGPLKDTTRRNYYIALLALHGKSLNSGGTKFKLTPATRKTYLKLNEDLYEKRLQSDDRQELTPAMRKNWLTWKKFGDIVRREVQKLSAMRNEWE